MYTLSNLFSIGVAGWCLGMGASLLMDRSYKSGVICASLGLANIAMVFV